MSTPHGTRFPVRKKSGISSSAFLGTLIVGVAAFLWVQNHRSPQETAPELSQNPQENTAAPATPTPKPAATPAPAPVVAVQEPTPTPKPDAKPQVAEAEEPEIKYSSAGDNPEAPLDPRLAKRLVLDSLAGNTGKNLKVLDDALDAAIVDGHWTEYEDLIVDSMKAEFKRGFGVSQLQDYDRFLKNPLFARLLVQFAFLQRLPPDARAMINSSPKDRGFYHWLMSTPAGMEPWLVALRDEDKVAAALRIWAAIDAEFPAAPAPSAKPQLSEAAGDGSARGKYMHLAIACALVYDTGAQIADSAELPPALERYKWYREHDQRGILTTRLSRMSARDLTWVVSIAVPESEREWSLKKLRNLSQGKWGETYTMVPYDMEKAVKHEQKKPYTSYILSEILEKGGICGDRTYFSVNTARSLGIPAAPITGDGPGGGHAWFAWKPDDQTWRTAGRIEGYAAGQTTDPQTGRKVSEKEFDRLSTRGAQNEDLAVQAARIVWFGWLHAAFKDAAAADKAMELAFNINRKAPDSWLAKLAWWRKTRAEAPVEQWRDFMDAWKKEFPQDTTMLAYAREVEQELIFPRQQTADNIRELHQDRRNLLDPRKSGGTETSADDLASNYKREAELLKAQKDWAGIRGVYRRALRAHASNPALFKRLAQDWFGMMPDKNERIEVVQELERILEKSVETNTADFFSAQSQSSARALVAQYWRAVGEEQKAAALEKKSERTMKRAKREAL